MQYTTSSSQNRIALGSRFGLPRHPAKDDEIIFVNQDGTEETGTVHEVIPEGFFIRVDNTSLFVRPLDEVELEDGVSLDATDWIVDQVRY